MAARTKNQPARVVLLVLSCSLLQFTLAARLLPQELRPRGSLLDDILGSSRTLVAERLYERADRYFHMGVSHLQPRALTDSWFDTMSATVSPRAHIHPEKTQQVEDIIPWLLLSIRTAPEQDTAYKVVAHWLSRELGRHEDALRVLEKGIPRVEEPHSLLVSRGRILLRLHRWSAAADSFDMAVTRAEQIALNGNSSDPDQLILDLREALLFAGFADEAAGRTNDAIASLSRYVEISGAPHLATEARIADLRAGRTPSPSAVEFFASHEVHHASFSERCEEHGHHHDH